jgi:endonuclease G
METKTKYALLGVAILAFIAGIAFEYVFATYLWPNRYQTYSWIYALRKPRKVGEPCKTDQVLDRQGYSLGYSYKHKAALWVSYIISEGSIGIHVGRLGNFYPDSDVPEKYRAKPEDFANTGYDKGHLAPSADIAFSSKANRETFALSNVVLQEPRLNRQAWGKLEDFVRNWTKTKGKLYIVTGPIFAADPDTIKGIAIPSKFYKVIYAYNAQKAIGFIFPHRAIPDDEVWRYAMSVRDVENKTGLTFFSNLSDQTQKQLREKADIAWWKGKE